MYSVKFLDKDKRPKRPTVDCGKGLTKQSMKSQCDVNLIMSKYHKTGLMNFVNTRQAEYMDVDNLDFQTAMNMVIDAQNMFADMPAELRKRFSNDPQNFFEFVHDPENIEEMYKLGLADRPETAVEAPIEPLEPETVETPT